MLIEGVDYLIRQLGGLNSKIKGFICEDADGVYNIYVNKDHTREQQMQTIKHELEHIENEALPRRPAGGPKAWINNIYTLLSTTEESSEVGFRIRLRT